MLGSKSCSHVILLFLWVATPLAFAQEAAVLEAPAKSTLTLASPFSDHMVLQRDARLPIWGTAQPGETVQVQLGDKTREATADENGQWRLDVGPLSVGDPLEMRVWTDGSALQLTDILVGDVWICSGQSNMRWTVGRSNNAESEIANADWSEIRLLNLPTVTASEPRDSIKSKGWQACNPESVKSFSAVGYFFGRELYSKLDVPIGLVNVAYGGTPMEAWTSRSALASRATFASAVKTAEDVVGGDDNLLKRKHPTGLYNAMIHPIIPFRMRGVIWYQGESNSGKHQHYHELSQLMIADWRERWGQGDFPFLLVQLAGYSPKTDGTWPYLREAQHRTMLTESNVGMAVATDVGDEKDIHPRNKQEVGKRLALVARALSYGEEIVYSGPVYKKMHAHEGQCVLTFDHVGEGLQAGTRRRRSGDERELKGFEIAGADRKFITANAKIDGDQVFVSSDQVSNPIAVRYNWSGWTEGNLYNADGLPAPPFRTDRF